MFVTRVSLGSLVLAAMICSSICFGEEPKADVPVKQLETGDAKIKAALSAKVSFEFEDTPLAEVIDFFRKLTPVSFVVDQATKDVAPPVTLKVTDVSLDKALTYVAHLTQANWAIHDDAVFISIPKDLLAELIKRKKEEEQQQAQEAVQKNQLKVRVKFANGNEVEVDGNTEDAHPGVAEALLERGIDPAQDGLLIYKTNAFPDKLKVAAIQNLIEANAKATLSNNVKFKLLIIKGEPQELRRVATLMRSLGCSTLAQPDNDKDEEPAPNNKVAEPEPKPEKANKLGEKTDNF